MTKSDFLLLTIIASLSVAIAYSLHKRRMPTVSPSRITVIEAERNGRAVLFRVDSHEYIGTGHEGAVIHHEGCPCKHNH